MRGLGNLKRVTIAEVAKYAQVSNSTVSQYLNKRYEYMSEATRLKVEQAIQALNYRPNKLARSLTQKSTFTIGVVVANIVHDFSIKVMNTLESIFDEHGFHMIVCNTIDDPEKERKHIEALLDKQVDGLIVFPTGQNIDLFSSLLKQKMPIVFIDRFIPTVPIPTVLTDNALAIEQAVSAMECYPVALITTSLKGKITPRIERVAGFKAALQKRAWPINEQYIHSVDTTEIGKVMETLMTLPEPPKGIIAGNDRVLREVLAYLSVHKQEVPEKLQLVSIDDVVYSSFLTPPLTVVAQPAVEIAHKAANILLKQIQQYEADEALVLHRLEPKLIKRHSTH